MRSRLARWGIFAVAPAAVLTLALTVGSAYACTAGSTLALSKTSGAAGSALYITGAGFTAGTPVVMHWNNAAGSTPGPMVASVLPSASGHIATTVRVPSHVAPGEYVLAATQPKVAGAGGSGALFDVSAPPSAAVPAPVHRGASASAARTSAKSGSVGLLTLVAVLGAIMLGLVAGGTLALRRRRPGATPSVRIPAASTPPASDTPASTPPASTPPASTPPASTPPASTPPPSAPPPSAPPPSDTPIAGSAHADEAPSTEYAGAAKASS